MKFYFNIKWLANAIGEGANEGKYDFDSFTIIKADSITNALSKLHDWANDEGITIVSAEQYDAPFYIE